MERNLRCSPEPRGKVRNPQRTHPGNRNTSSPRAPMLRLWSPPLGGAPALAAGTGSFCWGLPLSPILCPHPRARPCPSSMPSGCIYPRRNCSHSLFTTHYQGRPSRAGPCWARGLAGGERQPPPYTVGRQRPAPPSPVCPQPAWGPEPLGTSCPPGLALPELVACPGPWKRSSVWPLSHTQDRVKTWRRPASAPAFLPGDGRQLSPRGQASPAQSGPHGLRRDWPVWSQSTPSSFHPLWPTYHLKQGLWGGTQESAFHHGPALRLGTIRSRILGHSGCLASVIVGRGQ